MGQAVGEVAVVRQQQQPGGLGVEAADGVDARRADWTRSATVWRPCGSDIVVTTPAGLCSTRCAGRSAVPDRPAVDRDALSGLDPPPEVVDHLAVDRHAAAGDQRVGGTARGDAGLGQVAVEAEAGHTGSLRGAAARVTAHPDGHPGWRRPLPVGHRLAVSVETAASSAPVPPPELAAELAPPPDLLPRRAATVAGLPLVLAALALGLGTDVAAWAAPWALVGAAPYLLGPRAGRMTALAAGVRRADRRARPPSSAWSAASSRARAPRAACGRW